MNIPKIETKTDGRTVRKSYQELDDSGNPRTRVNKSRREVERWLKGCSLSTRNIVSTHELTALSKAMHACMAFADHHPETEIRIETDS